MDQLRRALNNTGRDDDDDDDQQQLCQVANAFVFDNKLYALFEVINARPPHAAVVLEIELANEVAYRPLLELDDHARNYFALGPAHHHAISRRGAIHTLEGGQHAVLPAPAEDSEISGMARMSADAVALLGEDGLVYELARGRCTKLSTGTEERILAAHFLRPDHGYAVGHFGTFLQGGTGGFAPVALPESAFDVPGKPRAKYWVVSVHGKADGTVLLGTEAGPAYVYERGELIQLEGLPDEGEASVRSVIEFQGVDYWGSEYGLLTRSGKTLVPRFPTGGAMCMNAPDGVLTVVAGSFVYVFDGRAWMQLRFHPDVDRLVERVDLDFKP